MGGSLVELTMFMETQQVHSEARMQKQREHDAQLRREAKAENADMEATMELQQATLKAEKAEMDAKMEQLKAELTVPPPAAAITQDGNGGCLARLT